MICFLLGDIYFTFIEQISDVRARGGFLFCPIHFKSERKKFCRWNECDDRNFHDIKLNYKQLNSVFINNKRNIYLPFCIIFISCTSYVLHYRVLRFASGCIAPLDYIPIIAQPHHALHTTHILYCRLDSATDMRGMISI